MSAPLAPPATTEASQLTKETYRGRIHPDWCPGCGDFSVLAALQTALFELELQPHQTCVISGIGCSSNLPGYINTYGMHTLHGRALAVATGVRLGNHELKVICTGGDGDGFGIGGNHFVHTMRRNVDLTYIVMDNQIYGLTTGQCSPTSVKGMKTKSTPYGSVENPINPIPMAIDLLLVVVSSSPPREMNRASLSRQRARYSGLSDAWKVISARSIAAATRSMS